MRVYEAPDGDRWGIEVMLPGSSNALILFRHSDGTSARRDRYAWYIGNGPEARSVTSRLDERAVLRALTDQDVARLFRRSWPVSRGTGPANEKLNRSA